MVTLCPSSLYLVIYFLWVLNMSFPKKTLLGSLLLLSATSVFAVDTADLRVIGTIAPTACTPTFAGGGVIDYGNIPTSSLSATDPTVLAARSINYSIQCDAPITIGASWTDGRRGTAYPVPGIEALRSFGLGTHAGVNIGQYTLRHGLGQTLGDGQPVDVIAQRVGDSVWAAGNLQNRVTTDGSFIYSFSAPGTLVPVAHSVFSGSVIVTPRIAPTSTLDISTSVVLDGLSTMTVRYL